jgi:pimeloyl-ACP methyl ester carboxylesterase
VTGDIRYVRSGGVAIAYKVVGEGDVDLAYVPDYVSNLVYDWEYPLWRDFYERLAQSFRLILFDKRGTGLSDHGGQFASLETRMEDLHAVLDAVGASSPVVLAAHEGCGMATLFAATYPDRTRILVLFHPGWQGHSPMKRPSENCASCAMAGARRNTRTGCSSRGVRLSQPTKPTANGSRTSSESVRAQRSPMR